jgi:hypothetical protein
MGAGASTSGRGSRLRYPGFCGGSYQSQARTADYEDTINYYVERMESPGATAQVVLYPTPGVEDIAASSVAGPGRAHFYENGREYAVIQTTFYEISRDGTLTSRGTVAMGSAFTVGRDTATISSNGDGGGQLFITSGDNGYIYDTTTHVFTQVAALNGIATMGDMIDGYFLALDVITSKFYVSDLLDGLTWDTGTSFAQRIAAPDPWRSLKVSGKYIWLFGEQTSEVWYDTGASPFPFALHPSGLIPHGIAASFSAAVADGSMVWLAGSKLGDAYVCRAAGLTPEVVSTYPLQSQFNSYEVISDAVAESFNYLGHVFYRLSFPTEGVTWAWDSLGGLWTKWQTWISEESRWVASRTRFHAFGFGEHRFLDSESGAVYRMAQELTEDVDERPIRRERIPPTLMDENNRLFVAYFELDLEVGLGTVTGQGEDPQVMLQVSKDGGRTWGSEQWRSAGKIGEYSRRARWNRTGSGRRWLPRIVTSDPIPWRLTNAYFGLAQPPESAAR